MNDVKIPVFSASGEGVLFEGVGQVLDSENKYVFPILSAETSSFSATPEQKFSDTQGEQITLVSGFQSRTNHRAIFSASMSMCSDQSIFDAIEQGNAALSPNLIFC